VPNDKKNDSTLPQSEQDAEVLVNAARYQHVRRMSARAFTELFERNLQTGIPFDQLVDEQRAAARPEFASTHVPATEHPPLGSEKWLAFFEGLPAEAARKYVAAKTRVGVFSSTDAGPLQWVVAFERSDFWADAFEDKAGAEVYAEAWNRQCPPLTA
jgi:hypothetical protein